MKYDMIAPCGNCPFRRKGFIPLHAARVAEIASGMLCSQGHTFACHKTTGYDNDGDTAIDDDTQHCGGALIFAEKNGNATQMMRIVERLGMYDARKLQPHYALVFDDLDEMLEAHARHPFNRPIKQRRLQAGRVAHRHQHGHRRRGLRRDALYLACGHSMSAHLPNTKRNRRWWEICKLLSDEEGLPQERAEALAWKILKTYEQTK